MSARLRLVQGGYNAAAQSTRGFLADALQLCQLAIDEVQPVQGLGEHTMVLTFAETCRLRDLLEAAMEQIDEDKKKAPATANS